MRVEARVACGAFFWATKGRVLLAKRIKGHWFAPAVLARVPAHVGGVTSEVGARGWGGQTHEMQSGIVAAGPCRGGTGRCISHCKYRRWTPTCGMTSRSQARMTPPINSSGPGNLSKVQDDLGAFSLSPGGMSQIRWPVARSFSSTSWLPDWLSGGTTCRYSAVAPSNRSPVTRSWTPVVSMPSIFERP